MPAYELTLTSLAGRARARARELLTKHWDAVERVAAAPLKARTLSLPGSEIDGFFED